MNNEVSIINPAKVLELDTIYKALKYTFRKDKDVEIEKHEHEPFNSMGYISVEGASIKFINTKIFKSLCQTGSNIEVYPKTNGKIRLNFTIHELTTLFK